MVKCLDLMSSSSGKLLSRLTIKGLNLLHPPHTSPSLYLYTLLTLERMRLTLDSTIDQRMLPLTLGKDTFDSEAELHAAVLCASLCELVPFPEKFDLAFEEEDDADEEDEDEAEQEQQEQQAQEEQEQEQEETGGRKRVAQRRYP